ncbi:hypothetical protein Pelo_18532 [Pelomyxa schiedti]|nr:hypothetical protein Pelo_18532 [Pelomyxa schiedti]
MIRDSSTGAVEHHNRAVWLSRLLWDNVVPWLVVSPTDDGDDDPTISSEDSVTLMNVGEGIFPLVPRMCRLVLAHDNKYYNALEAAAEAGAQSCLNWLIANHTNTNNNAYVEVSDQAGNRRNETKEFIRVLGGLCRAGHLDAATRLVDCACGGGGSWPSSGITWGGGCGEGREACIAEHVRMADILSEVCGRGHLNVDGCQGNLEVAKWIVASIADPQSLTNSTVSGSKFFRYIRKNCAAVCECIKEHTPLPFYPVDVDTIVNAEVMRWATYAFPFAATITSETVRKVCPKEGG